MNISKYKFDIPKLVNYIKQYKDELQNYNWNSDKAIDSAFEKKIISKDQFENLSKQNDLNKNILLKKIISQSINCTSEILELEKCYNWIINDWGKITTKLDDSYQKIEDILNKLKNNRELDLNRISSISKVLSFKDINNYIIYDSRIAYSINWILLKTEASNVFFYMPSSRNSKLTNFNMSTLLKLKEKDVKYIDKKENYYVMCELIKEISKKLWKDENKQEPFYTEMLLFYIADSIIIDDITKSVSLKIDNN